MRPQVLLLGTDHGYQRADPEIPAEHLRKFQELLVDVCRKYGIAAICEEMSVDSLAEHNRTFSLPKQVANCLHLEHRYCDPSRERQTSLAIADENAIRAGSAMKCVPEDQIDQLVFLERRKREPIWLECMKALAVWPALFICGSWHIPSFSKLLEDQPYSVQLVHSDWRA